jgi:hypothetical protein
MRRAAVLDNVIFGSPFDRHAAYGHIVTRNTIALPLFWTTPDNHCRTGSKIVSIDT